MNNHRPTNIFETYANEVKPSFSTQINEEWVDFSKMIMAIESLLSKNINQNVKLEFQNLSETVFEVKSSPLFEGIMPFQSIIIEDQKAEWTNGKLCLEFNWKYTEKSGKITKGDRLCQIEVDRLGNILKAS